jgi:DNA-binding response OmpR family regulator
MVREMTARMLEDAGYQVMSAGSGQEALRAMGDGRFDLLVTDLTMPEMSGRDLALRARSHRPDLPVLFITGHHAADLEGLTSSRATVLHKPYSPDVLVSAAERLLRGHGGRNRASLGDSGRISSPP